MAISAGKLIGVTKFEFQSRVILIPWVKKNFIRSCSKNSSFPVRYIPKNPSKTNELQTSSPPIKEYEDKRMNPHSRRFEDEEVHKCLDESSLSPARYIPKKSSKTNELQTSSPPIKEYKDKRTNPHSRCFEDEEVRKCLDGSSSSPARYIPKKSSKTDEFQTSLPLTKGYEDRRTNLRPRHSEDEHIPKCLDKSTRLPPPHGSEDKQMGKLPDTNSSGVEFSDVGRSSSRGCMPEDMSQKGNQNQGPTKSVKLIEMVEENYRKGGVKYEFLEEPTEAVEELEFRQRDAHEQLAFEVGKPREEVEKVAVELLATRAFSAVKLKKKLLGKNYPLHIVNAVIADFQSRGFINDSLYAETYSRSRWSSSSWSPRRIKKGLSEKGVNKVDAEKAVKLVFEDGEAGDDQVSNLGMSKLSMDHLLSQASKQWLRSRDVPIEKRKPRMIGWLLYRGFDWGVVSFVMKKLQSSNPL